MGSEENTRNRTALLIVLPLLAALAAGLLVWAACGARTAELEEERDAALERVEELEEEVSALIDSLAGDPGDDPANDDGTSDGTGTDTEEPGDGAAGETPDGRYFGFIREIDTTGPAPVITIDFAEMLTGDQAVAAAAAAGDDPPEGDFYISNVNPRLRNFPVETGITVEAVTEPPGVRPEGYSIALAEWIDMYRSVPAAREVPYWIELEGGTVTALEEQYLP